MNVKAVVEYDGSDFYGFQRQPSRTTVQGELERSLSDIFCEETRLVGAGRTDAGVHATGQVISFKMPDRFPLDRVIPAVNGKLVSGIKIKSVEAAEDGFHARYSAKARVYTYVVLNRETPSALMSRFAWQIESEMDWDAVRPAAAELVGTYDFSSFGMPDKQGASTVRKVDGVRIVRRGDTVFLTIKANAFLRGMVRSIMGVLVRIGQGKLSPGDLKDIIDKKDRSASGASAPPQGLFLVRVDY